MRAAAIEFHRDTDTLLERNKRIGLKRARRLPASLRRVNLCTECSGLSNWWPCWFRRARQGIPPVASRESPFLDLPPPSPTFLASAPRREGTHVRSYRTHEREIRCVLLRAGCQGACCTAHNPYSASPIPPTTARTTLQFLHPAATPLAVRAARHATPLGGDSYYFHFSNSVWGAGNVQHPPLCSLYTPPAQFSTTHEGFSLALAVSLFHPYIFSLFLSLSLSLSPGGQPKEKYLYLSVSSRDICLPLRPSRPLASPRAIRSVSFSFFSTPPPPWSFSVSPTPFSVSRYLSVSPPYSCSLSLPRFLSFFRPSPYLHPTTLLPTARVVAGETDTVGVSEPDRQRKGERRRVVGKREEKKEAKDGGYHDDDDDVDDDAGGRGEACAPFLGRRRDKETRRNGKGRGER